MSRSAPWPGSRSRRSPAAAPMRGCCSAPRPGSLGRLGHLDQGRQRQPRRRRGSGPAQPACADDPDPLAGRAAGLGEEPAARRRCAGDRGDQRDRERGHDRRRADRLRRPASGRVAGAHCAAARLRAGDLGGGVYARADSRRRARGAKWLGGGLRRGGAARTFRGYPHAASTTDRNSSTRACVINNVA